MKLSGNFTFFDAGLTLKDGTANEQSLIDGVARDAFAPSRTRPFAIQSVGLRPDVDSPSTRADLRDLATALPSDLRAISSVGGDIYAMSDSAIDFRLPTGISTICVLGAGLTSVVVPPATLASKSGLTTWNSAPVANDSVMIYDEGASSATTDDVWRPYKITAAPGVGACPLATNFTSTAAEAAAGITLTLNAAMPATTPAMSGIRPSSAAEGSCDRASRSTRST